jgi:hypothetical protein
MQAKSGFLVAALTAWFAAVCFVLPIVLVASEPPMPKKVEASKVGSLEYGDVTTTPWTNWTIGDPELAPWDTFTIHPEAANLSVPFHVRVEGVWRTEVRTAPGVTVVTFRRMR